MAFLVVSDIVDDDDEISSVFVFTHVLLSRFSQLRDFIVLHRFDW